jgi:hypothetical protein
MEAAIEVIGETVVAINGRVSASSLESVPEPEEQAAKERIKATPMAPNFVFLMALVYDFLLLLQIIRNKVFRAASPILGILGSCYLLVG